MGISEAIILKLFRRVLGTRVWQSVTIFSGIPIPCNPGRIPAVSNTAWYSVNIVPVNQRGEGSILRNKYILAIEIRMGENEGFELRRFCGNGWWNALNHF